MQENVNIPDSNITANLTFRQLVLMNMQQLTNFPYIEKDFDALTDYELLCLVVKFLNDVIANQNEQNDSITNMYNAFLALQTYVNNTKDTLENAFNTLDDYVRNYFDNLDVQEEINNKLDEMLEDGVLEQIIEQFIQSTALWCFNTTSDLSNATNLINGSFAKTLGHLTYNDGDGGFYKIRLKTSEDIIDGYNKVSIIEDSTIIAVRVNDGNMKMWVENKEMNTVTGFVNMNGYSLIPTEYQSFEDCQVYNGKLNFDAIATQNQEYPYYNAHVTWSGDIVVKNCEFESEHVTRIDLSHNGNIKFENCKFKNIYLHFSSVDNEGLSTIKIKDCKFTQTIGNPKSTYGSTEYIHITNISNKLENCIIEGNIFDTSENDCIDIFPSGSNILINGNTFTNCNATILEIKMQKQEANVKPARGIIVSNNFFKNMGDDVKCITMYNRDETESDPADLTLYPRVIYSNNIFTNERSGASGIACFYFYSTVKTQVSNCRTIGFNTVTNGKFLQTDNVQINVDNCISQAPQFIHETNASNTSKIYVSNCDALDDQINDTIGSVRYANELYMTNCRFRYPNITQSTNIIFLTNCVVTSNFQLSKGKYFITNCHIHGVSDTSVSETRPYMCITNSLTDTAINAQDWLVLENVVRS